MGVFHALTTAIVPEPCYSRMFSGEHALDNECYRVILAKLFGYAIVFTSALVKLPQIYVIAAERSVEGLSLAAISLELLAITFFSSYPVYMGYPFSSWGEAALLLVQVYIIATAVIYFRHGVALASTFASLYIVFIWLLMGGRTPLVVLEVLQGFTMTTNTVSMAIVTYSNYLQQHTGQLSAVTTFLILAGAVVRIFTTIIETHDMILLLMSLTTALGNALIAAQLVYYWEATAKRMSEVRQQIASEKSE